MTLLPEAASEITKRVELPPSAVCAVNVALAAAGDPSDLAGCVKHDPELSATVRRFAASLRYGGSGRSCDIDEAIGRLGSGMVARVVITEVVRGLLGRYNDAYGLSPAVQWRGAIGGAFAAEYLAMRKGFAEADVCFIAGLLRDVGKVAIDEQYGSGFVVSISKHARTNMSMVQCERLALGFDHADVGAALATRWDLPGRLASAIGHHHEPPDDDARQDTLFDIVHAGDAICRWAGLGGGHDARPHLFSRDVRTRLSIDRDAADATIAASLGLVVGFDEAWRG